VKRGERMENLLTTGIIQRKRDTDRHIVKILDGLCRWLSVKDNNKIFRDVHDRRRWRNMIANTFRKGL
jgi:hypothetical protein